RSPLVRTQGPQAGHALPLSGVQEPIEGSALPLPLRGASQAAQGEGTSRDREGGEVSTSRGGTMRTPLISGMLGAVLFGAPPSVPPGMQPYTPTKLEWLVVEINASSHLESGRGGVS